MKKYLWASLAILSTTLFAAYVHYITITNYEVTSDGISLPEALDAIYNHYSPNGCHYPASLDVDTDGLP